MTLILFLFFLFLYLYIFLLISTHIFFLSYMSPSLHSGVVHHLFSSLHPSAIVGLLEILLLVFELCTSSLHRQLIVTYLSFAFFILPLHSLYTSPSLHTPIYLSYSIYIFYLSPYLLFFLSLSPTLPSVPIHCHV